MFDKLPEYIDPINSVNHDKQFVGRVNQSRLKRLAEVTARAENDVQVELNFFYDRGLRFPSFIMKLETVLDLQCQRSLEMFQYPVKTELQGIFTETLALTKDLPADIEVFLLNEDEGKVFSYDWVEEELLLSVPLAPTDEASSLDYVNDTDNVSADDEGNLSASSGKPNPFAMLQKLKK
ncbi:MAG: hypothetical protein GXO35_03030 [Gammaproteobacteria bacterium]|nr:hypothetical protein [Gammaproteobacteria bacterium]